jgi:hypothetical protein
MAERAPSIPATASPEARMSDDHLQRYVIRHLPAGDQPGQDRSRADERGWADHRFTVELRQLRATQATGDLVLVDRRHARTLGERELRREAIGKA